MLWLASDARHALRGLARSPSFLLIATSILALCIGANTAIFSLVDAVLLKPLPFPQSERLVSVWRFDHPRGVEAWFSYPDYADVRSRDTTFSELGAFGLLPATVTGAGEPAKLRLGVVAGFEGTLRLDPKFGLSLTVADESPGAERVVLLGHRVWQRRFSSATEVLGTAIELNGESFTVVGVMPPGFDFPDRSDLWTPLPADAGGSASVA